MSTTLTLRLEIYAPLAKTAVQSAQTLAEERGHPEVEPLHLLHRLVERDPTVQDAIRAASLDPADVLLEAEAQLRRVPKLADAITYLSPRLLDVLGRAEGEAARAGGAPVDSAHLMLALAQEASGPVNTVLRAVGLSAPILRAMLHGGATQTTSSAASGASPVTLASTLGRSPSTTADTSAARRAPAPTGNSLAQFGRDLTQLAQQNKFDPMVGRDAELRRIIQVLARRRDNSPLLIGESGIGKTTLVQGLASRIARGDVPAMLMGKRIIGLETGALVSGAKLRGELEERVRGLLETLRDSAGDVILFLPDLGAIFGERSPGGMAELLVPALERGEVQVIAISSVEDLRKISADNPSALRCFVQIPIEPPRLDEAIGMLRGVVTRFEISHGVRISDRALVSAVHLAKRYVPAAQLPRAAVDLIDEAAARVRVQMESMPADLDAAQRRVESLKIQVDSLKDDHDAMSKTAKEKLATQLTDAETRATELRTRWQAELALVADARRTKEDLEAAEREAERAHNTGDAARSAELRTTNIATLTAHLKEVDDKLTDKSQPRMLHDAVGEDDVAAVVSAWTGVPITKMMEAEAEKLLRMEDRLGERVIGQGPAVLALSKAVRRGRAGLRDGKRPIGSFLFLGPTGVGKTELAKAVAEFLFDDEAALTRLDMSEFMEKHSVARLLGSPPGYVDSESGGFLTEAVRRRPYSVVLFDEVEKGHPDVFNILLQVLDDGRLTDSRGRLAYFADTVIILTSNIGGRAITDHEGDQESLRATINDELKKFFRPEFLNRIDDVVIFNRLEKKDLRGIVDVQLKGLQKLLAERRVRMEITDAAKDRLTDLGYQPAFGARPLKRVILKELMDPLADEVLRGGYAPESTVRIDVTDGKFTFAKA